MRPYPVEIPVQTLIGPTQPVGTPETRAVMISTATGSASWGGNTQKLGNATDTALFLGVRQWSDAVLVGAETVRTEDYGPATGTSGEQAERVARGQAPTPVMAVLSLTLDFNPSARIFTDPEHSPLILVPERVLTDAVQARRREQLEAAGAELISTGSGSPAEVIAALHDRGLVRLSCEGGPGVLGLFFSADLIDVLHLTLDPLATAPVEQPLVRMLRGTEPFAHRLELEDFRATADSSLFLRYRRRR
ncbi:pyrimidine reductase family protein [Corynebacterium halotolerans]|uniref:Bacterial bifunctional deaminase-reductase C-terminal domain-containing protein n=1 Tax=Corynebacterium halotolerans YIM 70093 = DSM 44683 TaxID=1121362 RepID=M1P7K7_9CORY|nr:pyrimidine reductase family protein [Corynebacterium halotolerans]AGF72636.1 hypothetical protein A605_08170 [Corynebacterium halotolerans YIM 70093 = DSM 44683]